MHCFICASEKNLITRKDIFKTVCKECNKSTPTKVNREAFDTAYWGKTLAASQIPESTKREFYADYLASTHNLKAYLSATTTQDQ